MSLILAIEPDHRQAGHLAQIVRRRLGVELILAETFDAALAAIGNRVPDLIMVPALLSPEDDASLKFVLRVIGGTSHVQVLTTPLFDGSRTKPSSRRMLSGLLRTRSTRDAGGADPEEFAKHLASYLRAAAERRASAPASIMIPPMPELEADTPDEIASVADEPFDVIELPQDLASADATVLLEELAHEELATADELPMPREFVASEEAVVLEAVDLVVDEELPTEVAATEVVAAEETAPEAVVTTAPATESTPAAVDYKAFNRLVDDLDLLLGAARVMPPAPLDRPARQGESERVPPPLTLEQLAVEIDAKFQGPATAAPVAHAPAAPRAEASPMANEWGLFDPKQCGIEALLVKLKEATDDRWRAR